MTKEAQFIKLAEHGEGIVSLTVTRPDALNALNADVLRELRDAASTLATRADLSAVIITGDGRAFVAGADIKAMLEMSSDEAEGFAQLGHGAMNAVAGIPVPVIAAINGFALGGGLELALSCDLLYASTKARVGLPEVGLGLIPGFGGTQRLGRLIGYHAARELVFTGGMIKADEALARGIVLRTFAPEDLFNEVLAIAKTIASKGPEAVRCAKRVMAQGRQMPLSDALELESQSFQELFDADEPREGMRAHLEKRAPKFR
jgi:enoyl-CoA hydratase